MIPTPRLDQLDTEQLRSLAAQLLTRVEHLDTQLASLDKEVLHQKTRNQQLIHEIALLKRHRFAKRSESFSPNQASLLDDLIETDLAAIEAELEILAPKPAQAAVRQQPKRTALPAEFPRTLIHHDPENTQCQCGCALKRIGEDVSEKLDYTPGVFSVERHIRGKWVCDNCET
ncbi:IS66 family transposase, partial [Pseudomonas sp. FSL R10-0399]|uniref:IS66 family transposase zinc-finger binding domain-containing protein n=1 Tax=Pseudomonas sp. FSL R10-0399 TaxID=2662194 RepID=UPI0013278BF3